MDYAALPQGKQKKQDCVMHIRFEHVDVHPELSVYVVLLVIKKQPKVQHCFSSFVCRT
jgi:hypothetical protein